MSAPRLRQISDDRLYQIVVALLYSRVSTAEQGAKGVSIPEQIESNRGYVAAHPSWVIGAEFQDIESGMRPTRAGYQAMLREVRRLKLARSEVVVVVKFQDRLGRDLKESIDVYFELTRLGVEVHIVDRHGAPSEDEFFIRAFVAHQESRNTGRRVAAVITNLVGHGWHKPGGASWGYRYRDRRDDEPWSRGEPVRLVDLDPIAAPYAREAWERFAAGESIRSIATWVQRLPADVRGGRDLSFNAVRKILRSPSYVARHGHMDDADPDAVLERPVGRWPQLVDDETWRRATRQRALARRMPKQARGEYPLTGLLRCSRCGGRMSGRVSVTRRPAGGRRREYICTAKINLGAKNADRRCSMTLRAEAIEVQVITFMVGMLRGAGDVARRKRIEREVERQEAAASGEPVGRKIRALEAARKKALDRLDRNEDRRNDGEIDAETYARGVARYRADKDAAEAELVELRGRVRETRSAPLSMVLPSCNGWADVVEHGEAEAIRAALGQFLESVAPVRLERGVYQPDFRWTPLGETVLGAAVIALKDGQTDEERILYDAIMTVDNLARARWSTVSVDAAAAG